MNGLERHIFVQMGKLVKKFSFKTERKALRFLEKCKREGLTVCAYC